MPLSSLRGTLYTRSSQFAGETSSSLDIDGLDDIGEAIADADLFIIDNGGGGTNTKTAVTRIPTYVFSGVSGAITINSSGVAAFPSTVEATNLTLSGDLTVNGSTVTINTSTVTIDDPMFALADNNSADTVDIGWYGKYVDSGTKYSGLVRDASDSDMWKLFATTGNSHEAPTTTVNTTSGFTLANLSVNELTGTIATAAQTNITSLGTLTGLTLDGDKSVTPGDGAMIHVDTSTITDSNTSGSGTAAKYTHITLEAPTLAATNSSVTTSDVATLYINAAATAGTNQTITRNWAMWVDTGNARFDGSIYSGTTEALSSAGLVTVANQSNITGVGTITSGTWEGTTVAVDQGGTGATSLSNLITLTTHTTGNYVSAITGGTGIDSTGATSGEGIGHTLSLDLSELTDTAIANGDYIVFTDTTDSNATVKGDLADVATLFAGTGLTASSSVIGVDASQTQITAVGTIATGTWEATDVAVAHGGTGASTATAGFDALSPMTAEGDVLYGGSSGTVTKLAKGSDGEFLKLASGVPTWGTVSAGTASGLDTTSASANLPVAKITNTHADATAGYLQFIKDPGSGQGADNDILGTISFLGTDASNNAPEELARIESYVVEADHGSEAGGMKFYVAENDATVTTGLHLQGQASDDGEIDVTIGAGAASTTTIAGTLTMGTTAAMTNAGLVSVANQSGITGLGTISSGTWEGTTVAVAQGGTGATTLNNLITLATHTTGDYVQNITAGTGLTSTGATSGENIAHSLSVDASQTGITALGTIATGTWEATDVAVAHGGTGASSLTANAVLTGNGTSAIQAETDLLFSSNKLIPTASAHNAAGTTLTMSAGTTTAGTTDNIAGGALTLQGGQGKGSGAGGDIIFQTANAGGSGSSLNSLATALTLSDDLSATFGANVVVPTGSTIGPVGDTDLVTLTASGNIVTIAGELSVTTLDIGGTNIGSTATELNLLDGGTSVGGSITIADADGFVVNDDGTMKTIPASDIKTYASGDSATKGFAIAMAVAL